ncbi:MAG: class I SAM-dependent methyltransferase [Bacteroidales bacterium]|nr:class I SAM-dependent methyltransferase [Bacteroidales bacterium]
MKYEDVHQFASKFSNKESGVLAEIRRDTWVNVMYPQMLTNELQGNIMQQISLMKSPNRILEIGAFTGYSAVCMAKGLTEDGMIDSIEINQELESRLKKNLAMAELESRVNLHFGNAIDIIPNLEHNFDLIYMDADKSQYPQYLKLLYPKLNKNGILLVDNVLWGGKMLNISEHKDKESKGIAGFLSLAPEFKWTQYGIIPMADGLWMGVK